MAIQELSKKVIEAVAGGLVTPAQNAGAALNPPVTPLSGPLVYARSFVLHVIQWGGHNFWSRAPLTPVV